MGDVRQALAEQLRNEARWRETRADEFPGEDRDLRSAERLRRLALYVESLPESDVRLAAFGGHVVGDVLVLTKHTRRAINRVGWDAPDDDLNQVITRLADVARSENPHSGRRLGHV
jgi:hypothetical protein